MAIRFEDELNKGETGTKRIANRSILLVFDANQGPDTFAKRDAIIRP